MYEKAINSIKKEIEEKEKLIKQLENFEKLDLSDKIQTMKKTEIRYNREELAPIIKNDFKSELLRNGTAKIGVNYFTITNDNYIFSVGLFNGKIIKIENKNKLITNFSRKERERYTTRIEEIDKNIKSLYGYKENSSYENFIKIYKILNLDYCSRIKFLQLYCFLNKKVEFKIKTLKDLKSLYEDYIKKYNDIENNNKNLIAENEKYKELINEDLNYFIDKGYHISYSFNCDNWHC